MRLAEYLETQRAPNGQGWTQTSFGSGIGVRQQKISRWAAGRAIPRRHYIQAIERVTAGQVTIRDFYDDSAAVAAVDVLCAADVQAIRARHDAGEALPVIAREFPTLAELREDCLIAALRERLKVRAAAGGKYDEAQAAA